MSNIIKLPLPPPHEQDLLKVRLRLHDVRHDRARLLLLARLTRDVVNDNREGPGWWNYDGPIPG
jgi:hypothetical protein